MLRLLCEDKHLVVGGDSGGVRAAVLADDVGAELSAVDVGSSDEAVAAVDDVGGAVVVSDEGDRRESTTTGHILSGRRFKMYLFTVWQGVFVTMLTLQHPFYVKVLLRHHFEI